MWSFFLSCYWFDPGRKITFISVLCVVKLTGRVVLSYLSVWGDGVAARAAGFFVRSCGFGYPWLGCDFRRREHFSLVLHRLHPRSSSSFPLSSIVPPDGACRFFILQLLLTPYRLHLPHSPLFIADTQHLHEVQLHLVVTGRKSRNSCVCLCGCRVMRDGWVFFIRRDWKGLSAQLIRFLNKSLGSSSLSLKKAAAPGTRADVFIHSFYACFFLSVFFLFWIHVSESLQMTLSRRAKVLGILHLCL